MSTTSQSDPHCIWNRKTSTPVLYGDQPAMLSAANAWSHVNPGSFLVIPTSQLMECADCDLQVRAFRRNGQVLDGSPDYVCDHCGWQQASPARGAAELCLTATWANAKAYERYRDVARSGGISVPDAPPNVHQAA